ncbi:hypothetical protein ACRAWF_41525 [Streptomyces sp. L7]
MFHALAFGEDAEAMPATALAWNAGGMGVHWTAATPWPAGDEVFDFGDPAGWAADLDTARRLLASSRPPPSAPPRSAAWSSTYCEALRHHRAGRPAPAADAHGRHDDGIRPHAAHRAGDDLPADRDRRGPRRSPW